MLALARLKPGSEIGLRRLDRSQLVLLSIECLLPLHDRRVQQFELRPLGLEPRDLGCAPFLGSLDLCRARGEVVGGAPMLLDPAHELGVLLRELGSHPRLRFLALVEAALHRTGFPDPLGKVGLPLPGPCLTPLEFFAACLEVTRAR